MSIFSIIGHIFGDLFSASQRAWDRLPKATQQSLLNGSGIMNIINSGINADPASVAATIQATYPQEVDAYNGLLVVARYWGIIGNNVPANLTDLIAIIQAYLKKVDQTDWPAIISGAAGLLATVLSGGSTPFEIISMLLQYVYTNFIKPKDVVLIEAPAVQDGKTVTAAAVDSKSN